jgi:hypothetical protein
MPADQMLPLSSSTVISRGSSPEEKLERGEVLYLATCPFPLSQGDDRLFLLDQRLANRAHKNISYDPHTHKANGFAQTSKRQAERVCDLLAAFSHQATTWMCKTFPRYSQGWQLDRVSYRPEEEATRRLRHKARNDLLHVDAFPSRPTNGHRILRLFVNINLADPRIWVTSDPFAKLLDRYGAKAGMPSMESAPLMNRLRKTMIGLFHPTRSKRSTYDEFMLRFHDYLKGNDEFQERGPKRFWSFAPNSAWLCFTDTTSHAVLRGRYALEHSYFISPHALELPEESPAALLAKASGMPVLNKAA